MWWCQPTHERTSYCPSPTSPLPSSSNSSTRCRAPCARATCQRFASRALLTVYHVRGFFSQLRITASRSRGPTTPPSS
jgi:hypothetical protein